MDFFRSFSFRFKTNESVQKTAIVRTTVYRVVQTKNGLQIRGRVHFMFVPELVHF
jgi:hypothetical protein